MEPRKKSEVPKESNYRTHKFGFGLSNLEDGFKGVGSNDDLVNQTSLFSLDLCWQTLNLLLGNFHPIQKVG